MARIELPVVRRRPLNGVILYRGPSELDGKPIVVVATGLDGSKNRKTGDVIQTYILADNGDRPTVALENGGDESVCGNCIHRKKNGWGSCYVNVGQGANQVYDAYKRGSYPEFELSMLDDHFSGRLVRLGSYGDPAAVPVRVWRLICGVTAGRMGYTHQWRTCNQELKEFCMASCETVAGMKRAKEKGWKSFRVRNNDEPVLPGEFVCPASDEAGKRLTCEDCKVCRGGEYKGAATPTIVVHGMFWKAKRFSAMQRRLRNKKAARNLDSRLIGIGSMSGAGTGVLSK